MLPGVGGSLVSGQFLEEDLARLFGGHLGEATRERAIREARLWWQRQGAVLGPASSLRTIVDVAALPLSVMLGFEATDVRFFVDRAIAAIILRGSSGAAATLLVTSWGADLDAVWRTAVRLGASLETPWSLCFNVTHLRLVDARRTYARRFIEFDLAVVVAHPETFAVCWGMLRAEALEVSPRDHGSTADGAALSLLDRIVESSAERALGVCASLREGVLDALVELVRGFVASGCPSGADKPSPPHLREILEQSLTIVYRMLFLFYAEARGLLPVWHSIYRESYAIETLRAIAERPTEPAGLWETLQAMSRLAHAGCHAGSLSVTPFNGRLFSPEQTPLAERGALDSRTVRRVILALSTESGRGGGGRQRISYRDLGVEQLGSVYESVLEYEPRVTAEPAESSPAPTRPSPGRRAAARRMADAPAAAGPCAAVSLEPGGGQRKASGTFYTPRSITEFLVRNALEPLVAEAPADAILRLRVLDPSMGSGAFLVAACRHLAAAYEAALVRDGACHASDISETERSGIRRSVAERCLFGVDLNPMAVQLARVSLWLTTLAADRPLTFLDHNLRVGDSLVGASLDDLARQPPAGSGGRARQARPLALPLVDADDVEHVLRAVLPLRGRIAREPSDSLPDVQSKEALLLRLNDPASELSRLKAAADLWCACWFWDAGRPPPDRRTYGDLAAAILHAGGALPGRAARPLLAEAHAIATTGRFFHWTLEFPEVFFDSGGRPLGNPGFDAVIGNPPWDMLRADTGSAADRERGRTATRRLISFARESGIYTISGKGHPNTFQLFVERALRLTRRGGRLGFIVPWGLASDHGCAALRRALIERADTDTLVGLENTAGVFPIHRSVRFLVLTATAGSRTDRIRCRFGERDPRALDTIPQTARDATAEHFPITLTTALLRRLSGDDLAIPDIRTPGDLAIVEGISSRFAPLGSDAGWNVRFSRELNASDDRRYFRPGGGPLPIVEGKHVDPFRVRVESCVSHIDGRDAARLVNAERTYRRARLAYRDVASATNRLTLIAAIVPPGCVTTHTLFCLTTRLTEEEQAFLCGILNSFVANFLVRQRVTTHVSAGTLSRIPAPRPASRSAMFGEGVRLCAALAAAADPERHEAYARLQALMAAAYRLTPEEFSRVLETFPLIEGETKAASREAFARLTLPAPPAGSRTGRGAPRP